MLLTAYAPFITGEQKLPPSSFKYTPINEDRLKAWQVELSKDPMCYSCFQATEDHINFLRNFSNLLNSATMEEATDMFYACKLGFMSPIIPSEYLYWLDKCYRKYTIANLIPKLMPERLLTNLFKEGFILGGFSLRDIIKSLFDAEYEPVSITNYKAPCTGGYELYIEATDMICAVPMDIGDMLTQKDIEALYVDKFGVKLKDIYLRTSLDYYGGVNSTYDLRRLI